MPKALALESNPFGRINELRSLLTDRYSRTAILKEWLQNADDAGATAVLVASAKTPPNCAHELLAAGSPAVVVLNDGKFDEKDSLAIRQFGLNNKSGDGAAIGKFGLGLKSVFHLCEGFFFLSPKSTADDPDGVFNNLVSPWSGTAHHAHWGDVDPADLDRLKAHFASACRRMGERWFALWLPLRRRDYTHSARILNEPHDRPPGELLAPPDVMHLAPAGALLKQLNRVELWDGMPAADDRPAHRWELRTPDERTSYPCWAPPNAAPATTGATRAGECDGGGGMASYALVEAWRNEKWANDAQGDDGWPSRFDLQGVPQRDKAQPHAAVVLTRRHGHEDGRLHDALAVFLPLTGGTASKPPPADAEFLLLRHGCFFVDSGRGGAYAGDGVRGEWNRELMRDGVLPLVVPAVAKLAERCDVAVTRRLTVAVQEWMAGHDRGAVCRDGGWACRWQPSGSRWEVIRNEVRVLKVPAFPEDGLPARVLPGLAGLAGDCALIPATEPRLLARDPEPWPDELLGRVLAVPEARPLLDGDALGYLVEFVALHRGQFGGSARQSLADTLRRVFSVASNGELAEHKDRLVRLVGEIPSDRRRRLSLGGNWPAKTRQAVCGVCAAVLVVPDGLDPGHASGVGLFATPDAVGVLKLLAADMSVGRNTNPAAEVIDASAEPAAVCDATAELPLWKVQRPEPDEKRDTDELRSLADLRTALDAQSLFVGPQNDELRELAAAVHTRLAVLNSDTARTLFAETPPPRGDTTGVLVHLQTAPGLRAPAARTPLVRRLMAATGDEFFRARRRWAVRYLIHANRDLSAKGDVYLPTGGAEVWARFARTGLSALGQADHLLPWNELAHELNSHQREELGLRPLDPDSVADILDRVPDLSGLGVEDDGERDAVLRGLQQHPKLIRRLPLHDRVGGGRVCLTDDSYWRDGAGVGLGKLADVVTLVIPHADEVLAAIQKKAWGKILTHREVVSLAVRHGPAAHWDTLLTAMASAGPLGREQAEPLTAMPWIPTADGSFVSPNAVLYDEKFNDEIAAAVKRAAPSAGDPVPFILLLHDVRVHVGFTALKRLFPDRKQALSKLGGLLGRSPQFHTGNVEGVGEWCEAFRDVPPDIMAAAPLISQVHRHALDECRSHLLPALDKQPTLDRLEKVLAFLRARHDRAAGPAGVFRRTHDGYLKQAANDPKFGDLLPRLRLLNSADPQRWVPVRELCAGVDGIDHSRALDPVQDDILGSRVARLPAQRLDAAEGSPGASAAAEREFDASAARLRDYFLPWRRTELLSAWAGAFVSLLGNHEPLRTLAMELLPHGYLPEIVRTNAGWQGTPPGIHQRRVLVRVTDPREPIEVRNLVGEPMTVTAVENARTLLIGYGLDPVEHRLPNRELRVRCLDLRATDPTAVTNLREVLGETGNLVLRVYYGVREQDARFQDALDSFRGDDEYGLQFAQEMFLNEGGDALRNRGLSRPNDPGLRALIGRFKQAEERKAQQQIAEQYDPNQSLPGDSALVLAYRARNELRRLIEGDRQAQAAILAGVRGRLVQAGYTPESVLFELFQNADDAYVERHRPAGAGSWFGVAVNADGITVSHDGRMINRPGPEHAYDLRKMLALHHSDKGVDGQDVTGKFGLGFKSVFLVCDDPRIVSGRLAVVVVGGAYPLPLDAAEATAIRRRLPSETSTLFHLPTLATTTPGWSEQFRRLAHLLPVFARRIREVRIDEKVVGWSELPVVPTPSGQVVVGRLATASGPRRALVVRCGELGDVLFGLCDDGFVAMPDDVPSVWVTAPTAEVHQVGYVVNARELPIDIGRSQVAWTQPDARRVLRGLAQVLGEALVALFDAGGAGLEVPANATVVWRSFWEVVKTKGERGELRDGLMWGPHGAARRLFTERNTLPTGLDAPGYSDLTNLNAVRGVVAGVMDHLTDVFRVVCGWRSFHAAHPPGTLAAASQAGDLLPELPRVDLASAVRLEMETPLVDPSRAAELGHVLSRESLNKLADRGGEIERVRESLKAAQFRDADGAWAAPTELVAAGAKGEEALRAGFAPPARVLAPGYTGTGVEFFQACRGDMQASVEILEGWVHKADTEEKRHAALRYLAQGELRQQLLLRLRLFRFNWTWLKALSRDQMLAAGLNELEQAQLAAATSPPTTPATPPLSQRPAADRVLERIASWWKKNQTSELEGYYGRIYPGGRRPAVTADDSLQIAAVREAWLKLLITGAVQTIGRVKPEQNRDFLRVCEREGWLGVLCNPANGPKEWLLAVERYVDNPKNHTNSIRYFHWLRHFVGVDTIARHLGAYASSFLSVDRFKTKFSLEKVLTSRSSPEFQFGGPDAPTLAPILGIGACFVLRELVRSNVVTKDGVHPYCFPPTRALRWRLEALGWQDDQKATPADRSRSVHKFLEEHYPTDPTFGSAFDIPLLTCPEDWFNPSATPDVSTTPSLFPGGGK